MKNLAFYTGLILIILGFSLGILLGAYFLFITLTIFTIGAILILISKIKFIYKTLIIIIPLLLYFPVNKKKNELYMYLKRKEFILPQNFSGPVRIVYGQKCGEKINTEDKTYKIPNDGIIILSENDNYPLNYQFYFIDNKNEKIRVPETEILTVNKPIPNIISMKTHESNNIGFHDYYVSINRDTIKYNLFGKNIKLDSLTILRINKCNGK